MVLIISGPGLYGPCLVCSVRVSVCLFIVSVKFHALCVCPCCLVHTPEIILNQNRHRLNYFLIAGSTAASLQYDGHSLVPAHEYHQNRGAHKFKIQEKGTKTLGIRLIIWTFCGGTHFFLLFLKSSEVPSWYPCHKYAKQKYYLWVPIGCGFVSTFRCIRVHYRILHPNGESKIYIYLNYARFLHT